MKKCCEHFSIPKTAAAVFVMPECKQTNNTDLESRIPDEETEFWLNDENFKPSRAGEIYSSFKCGIKKYAEASSSALKNACSKAEKKLRSGCVQFEDMVDQKLSLAKYTVSAIFSTLAMLPCHEGLHAVSSYAVGGETNAIQLGNMVIGDPSYSSSTYTFGGVTYSTVPVGAGEFFHTILPDALFGILGVCYLRKGLKEKSPVKFGVGVVGVMQPLDFLGGPISHYTPDMVRCAEIMGNYLGHSQTANAVSLAALTAAIFTSGYAVSKKLELRA